MAKKISLAFSERFFLDRGYVRNASGGFDPPPVKSEFIRAQKGQLVIKEPSSILPIKKVDEFTYLGFKSKPLVVFNITPIGAPRMTKSDTWKLNPSHPNPKQRQRKPVTQYFRFKNQIREQALINNFTLPESGFHAIFIIPMSHSWSDKKKGLMDGTPHQQKPDTDNIIKAVKDSLCDNDANIWDYRITKYWGRAGKIVIYPI
jgi:Holliday junction resolvase RusA-like endonuclease